MRVTISLPCWARPQRTIRSIENICAQSINGWQALVVGDGCQHLRLFMESEHCKDLIQAASANGNELNISNLGHQHGSCGYEITNQNIKNAKGEYFLFFGNDDVILPNHFENYLSGIEGTDYDFVYFDTFIEPTNSVRVSTICEGNIGHSELIVKTDFLKKMPPHGREYGHDFTLINNMVNYPNVKYRKFANIDKTYIVKGIGSFRTDTID